MLFLSLIALLLGGASLALIARAVVLPRMQAAERVESLELYGFRPPVPIAGEQKRPALADLAGRIGESAGRRLGTARMDALRRELIAAGIYRVSAGALTGYRIIACVVIGASGLILARDLGPVLGTPTAIVCALLGWYTPLVFVRRRARHRLMQIERELPDLIDLLVVTVEAGTGLAGALQLATRKLHGPLADELRITLQEQRMGRGLTEALGGMLARVDTPNVRSFVRSVAQGETLGVSIGTIMRNLADEMRKRRRALAQEQANKAPVRMLFPLVLLILPAFLVTILGPALFSLSDSLR